MNKYSAYLLLFLCLASTVPAATAQEYSNSYVMGPSEYDCGSTNYVVKHQLKEGHPEVAGYAAFSEGLCLLDGRKQFGGYGKQNVPKAISWFQKAVTFGVRDMPSAGYVGYRFLGMGFPSVPANRELADYWLHVAAKSYDSTAKYNLGVAYLRGDVLPQDNKLALEWLKAAVQFSNSNAMVVMARIYREGKIVPQDLQYANSLTKSAPEFAAAEAARESESRARKDQLQADLNQISANSHAAMVNSLTQGISDIVTQAATPNPITVAANQQLSQINTTAAQQQQQRQNAAAQEALNKMLAKQASTQGTQPAVAPSKPAASPQPVIASVQVPTLAITPAVVSPATTASASGSSSSHNVTPIGNSCITMDFNGEYHWDRYTSHCGVPVHVDLVFQRPLGVVSILHLEDGRPQGTAHSRADYEKYGNPSIYVCPDGSHMVDSTGNAYPQTAPAVYYCRLNGW